MTTAQRKHYRARLWPQACKAQGWDVTDDEKRREVTREATGQDSTAKLNNKQVDRLFRKLNFLGNPQDFDLAYAEANPEIADEEARRDRIIVRIDREAKKRGFNASYIEAMAAHKVKARRVQSWKQLPTAQLENLSKTICGRPIKSQSSAVDLQEACNDPAEDQIPAELMPF